MPCRRRHHRRGGADHAVHPLGRYGRSGIGAGTAESHGLGAEPRPGRLIAMSSLASNRIGDTGVNVTALGFGCASMGNLYRTMDDAAAHATVAAALDGGIG